MSHVLTLAADFIERMSNPGYGIRVNEDYAMRLGALLSSDGFEEMLDREIRHLRDPETITPHGWLWILSRARARHLRLDDKLLLDLAESFSSAFMQMAVIDAATVHFEWRTREAVSSLEEFGHSWLSMLLRECTKGHNEADVKHPHIDTRRVETVLVALMQVGRDITLDAASTLLNHQWIGQSRLLGFFWSLCEELDEETRENWIRRLRPPELR